MTAGPITPLCPPRRGPRPDAAREERIIELRAAGWSARDIGAELGMTRNTVLGKIHAMRARGVDVPGGLPTQQRDAGRHDAPRAVSLVAAPPGPQARGDGHPDWRCAMPGCRCTRQPGRDLCAQCIAWALRRREGTP